MSDIIDMMCVHGRIYCPCGCHDRLVDEGEGKLILASDGSVAGVWIPEEADCDIEEGWDE